MKRARIVSLFAKIFLIAAALANAGVLVVVIMTADFAESPDIIELIIIAACNIAIPLLLCYMIKGDPFGKKEKMWKDADDAPDKMMARRVMSMVFLSIAEIVLLLISLLPPFVAKRLIAVAVALGVSLVAFALLFITLTLYRKEHNKKAAEESPAAEEDKSAETED